MISLFKLRIYCSHHVQFKRALSTSQLKEYYALLDVDKTSTKQQIKNSFLKLSKVYHPDNKITGSHNKFVKLKEAYDAIKDGPPAISQSYSASTSNPYSNYDPYADLSHKGHAYYRERSKTYERSYGQSDGRTSAGAGFGGPYSRSSTPWEDLMKEKEYKRRKYYESYKGSTGPMVSITLILSGLAWIVIGSCIIEAWKLNTEARGKYYSDNIQEYREYQDYLSRREAARDKLNKPRYGYYVSKEAKKRLEEAAVAASVPNKINADSSSNLNETNPLVSISTEGKPQSIVEEDSINLLDTGAAAKRLVV